MKSLMTVVLSALFLVPLAQATSITYTLTFDGCTGTCGTAPFGSITIADNGSGNTAFVTVTETLKAGEVFVKTGAGDSIEFNLSPTRTGVTITNLSDAANFTAGGAASASSFGSFTNNVDCTGCSGGNPGNPGGPLSFQVHATNGVTVADFIANAGGYFFAADIRGTNGNTGNVAVKGGISDAPEPSTLLTLAAGLVGMLSLRPHRSRNAA